MSEEAENDVALKLDLSDNKIRVFGRGDLHLGVLFERMRRIGFELMISPPEVVTKVIDGAKCEPYEDVSIEVDAEYSSMIIDKMNNRKGDYISCTDQKDGKQKLSFQVPTRGLIGLRS